MCNVGFLIFILVLFRKEFSFSQGYPNRNSGFAFIVPVHEDRDHNESETFTLRSFRSNILKMFILIFFNVDTLRGNRNKYNFPDLAAPNRSWVRNVITVSRRPARKSRYAFWLSRGKKTFLFQTWREIRFQKFPVARTDGETKTSRVTRTKKRR